MIMREGGRVAKGSASTGKLVFRSTSPRGRAWPCFESALSRSIVRTLSSILIKSSSPVFA